MFLEDLNAMPPNMALPRVKSGDALVIDSFHKYEQMKNRSNEGSPVGQPGPTNFADMRKKANKEYGINLGKPNHAKKKSQNKPIELVDVNKVSLLIGEEQELSRDLDQEEDIHVDRYLMRGSA